jgi:hypothetical protein
MPYVSTVPYFKLHCECGHSKGKLGSSFEALTEEDLKCVKCGAKMSRKVKAPSTLIMERLDNGVMARAVERYSDAEELFKKRHEEADPLAGAKPNRS